MVTVSHNGLRTYVNALVFTNTFINLQKTIINTDPNMQLTLIHTIKQITPRATNVQLVGTLNIVTKHLRIDYVPTDLTVRMQ